MWHPVSLDDEFDRPVFLRHRRRQDEVGTPWCITIDGDTLKEGVVTVRERDSMKQERVRTDEVAAYLRDAQRSWKPR